MAAALHLPASWSMSTAAQGEQWHFHDLDHGYGTDDVFDRCPHRMPCARCAFRLRKGSSRALLLECKANLLRMQQEIPLSDEERAAVDDGLEPLDRQCAASRMCRRRLARRRGNWG